MISYLGITALQGQSMYRNDYHPSSSKTIWWLSTFSLPVMCCIPDSLEMQDIDKIFFPRVCNQHLDCTLKNLKRTGMAIPF